MCAHCRRLRARRVNRTARPFRTLGLDHRSDDSVADCDIRSSSARFAQRKGVAAEINERLIVACGRDDAFHDLAMTGGRRAGSSCSMPARNSSIVFGSGGHGRASGHSTCHRYDSPHTGGRGRNPSTRRHVGPSGWPISPSFCAPRERRSLRPRARICEPSSRMTLQRTPSGAGSLTPTRSSARSAGPPSGQRSRRVDGRKTPRSRSSPESNSPTAKRFSARCDTACPSTPSSFPPQAPPPSFWG